MSNINRQNQVPVISGSGRSGTTWVQDVLAQSNSLRTAFEPLHPVAVPDMKQFANQYIDCNQEAPYLKQYLQGIFNGDFKNIWIDYRVRPDRLIPCVSNLNSMTSVQEYFARWRKLYRQSRTYKRDQSRSVLTKFIRANLMYSWLLENFDMRIVHLSRHPCAVIESKLRLGGDDWDVNKELKSYLNQKIIATWVSTFMDRESVNHLTQAGSYALIWCIENSMQVLDSDKRILKVHFETLASHDESAWKLLCQHLNLKKIPDKSLMSKPSQQARPENKDKNHDLKMTSNWRDRLSDNLMKEIESVLLCFKVSEYSINQLQPIIKN